MNHETTIKIIQELTDGMKLEFGCEVLDLKHQSWGHSDPIIITLVEYDYLDEHKNPKDALSSFLHYRGNPIIKIMTQEILDNEKYTILGKPITLAVVLLAIEKKNKAKLELTVTEWGDVLGFWNLSKDNFNDQSDETKEFIGELLN